MNSSMKTDDSGDKSEFVANLNVFRQIEFFSGVSIEVMKLFAFLCQRQFYQKGDFIFRQDDDDGCSYYILSGKVKLVLNAGGKEHSIREYGAESYFGALSLVTPMVKQFSLIAIQDTVCMVMSRKAFSKVVDQFPDIHVTIARSIGKRLLQAERKCIHEFELKERDELKNLLGISLI
ncbi:MAG: Crp/Fnr family transcriptional regulator [Deltaproteobacteria bacterium]|nr:Crp/Fnr family transcriptional regulator [Deltaproteobacteria bacterium]